MFILLIQGESFIYIAEVIIN